MVISMSLVLCPYKKIWCGVIRGITKDGTDFVFDAKAAHRIVCMRMLSGKVREFAQKYDWIEI